MDIGHFRNLKNITIIILLEPSENPQKAYELP